MHNYYIGDFYGTCIFRLNTYRYMTAIIFIRVSAIHNQNAADGVIILPGNYINNLEYLNKLLKY